tara:strand:- start:1700 stop:2413 length:714 start_codon:yes stop_codon:yes gene_type:complete
MKQAIIIILAVYIIVYLCIKIYNKPNYEFFLADNLIPSEPKFVKAIFSNGGLNIKWEPPDRKVSLSKYEFIIRDNNMKHIKSIKVNSGSLNGYNYIIKNRSILSNKQYSVEMKAINNNGKSISSKSVIVSPEASNRRTPELSRGTISSIDMDSKIFKEQESAQNIQNISINSLKKRVDALRNDIVIFKNKEKEENKSIYNRFDNDDSISQLPSSVRDRYGLNIPSEIDFNFTIDPTL